MKSCFNGFAGFEEPQTRTLWLGKAVPRDWLVAEEAPIVADNVTTRYGRVWLSLKALKASSTSGYSVKANVTLPASFATFVHNDVAPPCENMHGIVYAKLILGPGTTEDMLVRTRACMRACVGGRIRGMSTSGWFSLELLDLLPPGAGTRRKAASACAFVHRLATRAR